jgi:hypothetical protein
MSAKRQANLEAARTQVVSAAAAPPRLDLIAPEKRNIVFHLTPFAPGCEHASASDQIRTMTFYSRRPGQALDGLCKRLEVGPRAINIEGMPNGDVAFHPVGLPGKPWAFAWEGLTFAEAADALDQLIRLRGDQ